MNPDIGLQLWSVRNSLQKDYFWTLEKIAEVGYRNLELITTVTPEGLVFGQDMRAPELRKNLDRLGLRAVGCHFVPNAEMRLERILADLQVLGVDSLACAIAFFANQSEVIEFNNTFNHYAEICKKHGVQLYYHNHFHEFQVFDGKSIFEMMIEQMDKDRLVLRDQGLKFSHRLFGWNGDIGIVLRSFRTEGAFVPVASARSAVGENESRREVIVNQQGAVIRRIVILLRLFDAEQIKQRSFSRTRDKVINETAEGILPVRSFHP